MTCVQRVACDLWLQRVACDLWLQDYVKSISPQLFDEEEEEEEEDA